MAPGWIIENGSGERLTLRPRQSAILTQDGRLITCEAKPAESAAFFRAHDRRLWIAAPPGSLYVNGLPALGGVASINSGTSHTVRIGRNVLQINLAEPSKYYEGAQGAQTRCPLSGEPMVRGDEVFVCTHCSTTALAKFVRQLGDGRSCPRCGRRRMEGKN